MQETVPDPFSVAGKTLPVREHVALLVIGAGPAGLAAAIEAAGRGLTVMVVDENPVPGATIGDDIPLMFGQRFSGAARNVTAMTEALVASEPMIAAAFDAGVDVRLGVAVWGLYANNASVGWLPGPLAGLSDGEQSWLLGFDRAIVATGHRDMGLAFPGWDLPGVMGAAAAVRLANRYGALEARRAVVLGSSAEAWAAVAAMEAAGVEVAAIVEQAAAPLEAGDRAVSCASAIRSAEGAAGVESVTLAGPHGEIRIECDTVVLAVGAVPVIELLDALGCRIVFDGGRGGHVPVLSAGGRTSVAQVYAVGDCAGVWPAKTRDRAIAEAEGRSAAAHVAASLGQPGVDLPEPPDVPAGGHDLAAYRLGWVRGVVVAATGEPHVCRCESVTAREIVEVRPPRYLGAGSDGRNARDLSTLLGNGPPNPDQVKRLTRAGMGVCQGRRCREQVAALLALAGNVALGAVPLAGYRAPVRPLPLALAAASPESPAMSAHWDTWFGMPSQILAPWEIASDE